MDVVGLSYVVFHTPLMCECVNTTEILLITIVPVEFAP